MTEKLVCPILYLGTELSLINVQLAIHNRAPNESLKKMVNSNTINCIEDKCAMWENHSEKCGLRTS